MKKLLLMSILFLTLGCSMHGENAKVKSYGSRQAIIKENNLDGIVNLDTLITDNHLYAIGPVAGLRGEITIYNDQVSVSSVRNGTPNVIENTDTEAIFLIRAYQRDWKEIGITRNLNGLDEIEFFLKDMMLKNGMDTTQPSVFRIEANVPSMEYHIIFKNNDAPHNMEEHHKAKVKFSLKNTDVKMVGFWMDEERVGKLTHPGKRTHLHFLEANNTTSGHVDDIIIKEGSILFLPKFQ